MCFSLYTSISAASLLALIAAGSLQKATNRSYKLALIPLFFSIQQFCEASVWYILQTDRYTSVLPFFSFSFLLFALVIWPVWIPLSLKDVEYNRHRKNILHHLLCIGGVFSSGALALLLTTGVSSHIAHNHIVYLLKDFPETPYNTLIYHSSILIYTIVTILPFFVSSKRYMNLLGLLVAISALSTYIIWYTAFTSIWCFFTALISLGVYFLI